MEKEIQVRNGFAGHVTETRKIKKGLKKKKKGVVLPEPA